jgi:hypothetical protein
MAWTPLDFGRYSGKTLPQVVLSDPDWFFSAWEEGDFEVREPYTSQAKDIYRKATHIRVPQGGQEKLVVEYTINVGSRKFTGAELVPASRPHRPGASPTFRGDVFDLSALKGFVACDQLGRSLLVQSLKQCIFGDPEKRFTRKVCEEFFDDPDNFSSSE